MGERLPKCGRSRAIIGVVALWAFLLQALVAAASPAPLAGPLGVICGAHNPAAPNPDRHIAHNHHCCAPASIGKIAPPPTSLFLIGWGSRPAHMLIWRIESFLPKTGPPTDARSARGPPAA